MINAETLKLLSIIERLQKKFKNGVENFECLQGDTDSLIIDEYDSFLLSLLEVEVGKLKSFADYYRQNYENIRVSWCFDN